MSQEVHRQNVDWETFLLEDLWTGSTFLEHIVTLNCSMHLAARIAPSFHLLTVTVQSCYAWLSNSCWHRKKQWTLMPCGRCSARLTAFTVAKCLRIRWADGICGLHLHPDFFLCTVYFNQHWSGFLSCLELLYFDLSCCPTKQASESSSGTSLFNQLNSFWTSINALWLKASVLEKF